MASFFPLTVNHPLLTRSRKQIHRVNFVVPAEFFHFPNPLIEVGERSVMRAVITIFDDEILLPATGVNKDRVMHKFERWESKSMMC